MKLFNKNYYVRDIKEDKKTESGLFVDVITIPAQVLRSEVLEVPEDKSLFINKGDIIYRPKMTGMQFEEGIFIEESSILGVETR